MDCATKCYRNNGNLPLLDLIPAGPGEALDCGCGAGDSARILQQRGWKVTGITISQREQAEARQHCSRVELANLERGLPGSVKGPFDLVLMSHVLEHLVDPGPLLRCATKVLKPDGLIAIALPNVLWWKQRLRFLLGRFDYEPTGVMDETHVRFYTYSSAKELLKTHGLEIVEASAEGRIPWWKLRRLIPMRMVGYLNRLAGHVWPRLFGHQLLFLAKPAEPCEGASR